MLSAAPPVAAGHMAFGPVEPAMRLTGQVDTSNAELRVLLACDRLGHDIGGFHGAGRCMVEWTRGLVERGVAVTPVILRASHELRAVVEAEHLPFVFLNRASFDPRTAHDFISLIRKNGVQLLHLQGHGSCLFGRLAALATGVPTIVHVHADYRYSPKGYPWYVRLADRLLARGTDHAFAISRVVRDFAVAMQGFQPSQVEVLHNPVDRQRFRPPSPDQRAAARRSLGIEPEAVVAVSVGRIDRVKGIDLVLDSWGAVVAAVPHAVLILAGDGPLRGVLERGAASAPWGRSVQFLGYRSDVERVLWGADVAVMASRREGLPLAALEAMSTGLPVVGAQVGGIAEIVHSGRNGVLVPAGDVPALASELTALLRDEDRRRTLGAGAVQSVEGYGLPHFAERLEATYRRLVR